MPKENLTDPFIRNYPNPDKRVEIYDEHTPGLALRVTQTGKKSFVYRYRHKSKVKRYTIGSYPKIGLAKARKEVKRLAFEVSQNVDPLKERQKEKRKPDLLTFADLAEEFKSKYLPTLRETTRSEYERIIDNELVPKLGTYELPDITKHEVISLLDYKAFKDKSPTMANRIRARLSKVFNFAISRGLAEFNPVSQTPKYKHGENKRDRFYDQDEIRRIWNAALLQNEPGRSIIMMLFYTGQRVGETKKMKKSMIKDGIWTIPPADAKNASLHEVPLSDQAVNVINQLEPLSEKCDFVFESPVNNGQPIKSLKRVKENIQKISGVTDFRLHDIRRTVTTYMAKLNINRTVLEKVLNQNLNRGGNRVISIYDRHDYFQEKKEAINAWTEYLMQILVKPKKTSKDSSSK